MEPQKILSSMFTGISRLILAALISLPIKAAFPSGWTRKCPITLQGSQDSGQQYAGKIDELRFYVGQTSSDWITTEYTNQSSPSTFWSVGTPVSAAGAAATRRIIGI